MRHALAAVTFPLVACSLVALPSLAEAGPITAGVHLGLTQSELEAQDGGDASRTLGLFGRLGFTHRLSGQLEVSRVQTEEPGVEVRKATALLVVDLTGSGRLVPTLSAGIGVDQATTYGYQIETSHIEGGVGLEYRADGGLTIGADVRVGARSLRGYGDEVVWPADVRGDATYILPPTLRDDEYRVARLTVGIRF